METNKTTLVTGLWDINRDKLGDYWNRTYDHYLYKFNELLQVDNNLIIFGDEELRKFVFERRSEKNTQFILRDKEWFKNNQYFDKIQQIRNNPQWFNQSGWLPESTQARLEYYNPLVMSKMFLLHDAKILDSFNSDYLFWIDAGITNTVHPGYFTHDKVLNNLEKIVKNFLFVTFPYEAINEIHGFEFNELNRIARSKVNKVARGGFFGGKKESISDANSIYYNLMMSTLNDGYMGTEESIFSIMLYKYPELFDYAEINYDGLVSTFFEDLKNNNVKLKSESKVMSNIDTNNVGLYVITFNSPKQFKVLIDSMLKYDPDFINKPKKYLLDNSTDLSTTPEYVELCEQYGFEHIKKDNLGIVRGRVFIADHFNNSEHDVQIFFEDDMAFFDKDSNNNLCRNGFNRYVPNLYSKALQILKKENFDFLKLNFTEFYGSNDIQFSWYNVPQEFRERNWPEKPNLPEAGLDPNAPNTKFTHIKSYQGIPYASGDIYICNWPIMLTKSGNYKCYIETQFAYPHEQTLMSYVYQETIKGNINPGILLLTPTEHNRFDFYDGSLRKEC